jgi:hypothetical protein
MRLRLGFTLGFGAGYYLGAKAGRERYEELRRWIDQLRQSEALETAEEKTKAVIDLGVERARDLVEERRGNGGSDQPTATGDATAPIVPGTADVNDPMPRT